MNDRTLSRLRCFIPYGITPGANVGLGHALSQKFPDQIRPAAPAPVVRMSCPCCEEPEDVNNMLFCPKDHALCKECVRVLGDLKLSKGATQLLCEESRCKTAFPDKLLFRLLNNSQLKLLNKNRALKEIKESGIKAILRECPVCETPFWQAKGDELLTKMHCGACGTTSCIPCAAYHKGMDCAEYMDYKQRQSSQSEKHAINEAMSQALILQPVFNSSSFLLLEFIKENNGCPMYYKLTTQAQHEEEVRAAAEAEALKRSNTNKDSVD
ncbi:hypothetical protein FRB98_008184 [Tulasnella sp. 332]|nr:hypothetical protein FRB98_008184 [Tulasnella sp. 332]